ncbi:hypothetical protein MMC07_001886 [Pseudocyphellaria aurata]|nr:hypothetical protein [Pseudocyphellaria aurata]
MSHSALGLSPAEIAYERAHIHEDKRGSTIAGLAVLSVVSTIAVALKLTSRRRTRAGLQADDYTISVALVFGWLNFVTGLLVTRYGFGLHVIAVPPGNFKVLAEILYFTWPVYFIGVALTQISILFLYRRTFTLLILWFRIAFYALLFLSAGSGIAISLALIFRCTPISAGWAPDIREAHCGVDVRKLAVASCLVNLVVDVLVVVAPMPLIWKLRVNLKTKAALTGMFLLAGFVCIINVVKLVYSLEASATDFTWDVRVLIWTHAELTLGIVSVCLPCYKPLFAGLGGVFSTVFSTKKTSKSTTNPEYKKSKDAFPSSDAKKNSGLTGSETELVSRDEWDESKSAVVKPKASAESGLALHDFEPGIASSHSPV